MMKVKRIFAVILAFLLVFSMCGCEELEKLPFPTAMKAALKYCHTVFFG